MLDKSTLKQHFVQRLKTLHIPWLQTEVSKCNRHRPWDLNDLSCGVGPVRAGFWGGSESHHDKREVDDAYITSDGSTIPALVIEAGTPEVRKKLLQDMHNWMTWGRGGVRKVLVLVWIEVAPEVIGGRIEVYDWDKDKNTGILTQQVALLPRAGDEESFIAVQAGELYENVTEQQADLVLHLSFESLIIWATEEIEIYGYSVAGDEHLHKVILKTDTEFGSKPRPSISNVNSGNNNHNNNGNIYTNSNNITNNTFQILLPAEVMKVMLKSYSNLGAFSSNNTEELSELVSAKLGPTQQELGLPTKSDSIGLTMVSVYDVVVLCDDSGSMKIAGRFDILTEAVQRITPIATKLNNSGISIRFLNFRQDQDFNHLKRAEDINNALRKIVPKGPTMIGTALREKVINPMVLGKARRSELVNPVIVTIITDGQPFREDENELKHAILDCKNELKTLTNAAGEVYGPSAVVFLISYIGDDPEAAKFVAQLEADEDISDLVYCNPKKIDESLKNPDLGLRNREILEFFRAAIEKSY